MFKLRNGPLILPPSAPVRPMRTDRSLVADLVMTLVMTLAVAVGGVIGLILLAIDPYGPYMQ